MPDDLGLVDFVRVVIDGDTRKVSRYLTRTPTLATAASDVGATRQDASTFFFADIAHYLYEGDTALHMAAAAFRRQVAELLMAHGADCRAVNRRGAQPLHYAADANHWDPAGQADTIAYLISVGADPNAIDSAGVAPLHRAVRTRSLAAVQALLDGGANSRQPNRAGSTPLHLAVHNTGRGGSGSPQGREQQAGIIRLLLERGASVTDRDTAAPGWLLFKKADAPVKITQDSSRPTDHEQPGRIRCPLCQWQPDASSTWVCWSGDGPEPPFEACGTSWNTFATRGRCPGCSHQWTWTSCLRCDKWSPHEDWYDQSDG